MCGSGLVRWQLASPSAPETKGESAPVVPVVGGAGLGDKGRDEIPDGRFPIERLLHAVLELDCVIARVSRLCSLLLAAAEYPQKTDQKQQERNAGRSTVSDVGHTSISRVTRTDVSRWRDVLARPSVSDVGELLTVSDVGELSTASDAGELQVPGPSRQGLNYPARTKEVLLRWG
jgi:hypothetical protein